MPLNDTDLDSNPLIQFSRWFEDARAAIKDLPEGMTLATANHEGEVSGRVVLLKEFDERGFVFYTNYNSRKGAQIHDNPRAALTFWWPSMQRQIRIEGAIVRTTEEESDAYFATRARDSQLGAWASDQSHPLDARETFEERFEQVKRQFEGKDVPRPPHWGGYRVIPARIEFWIDRPYRLHERRLFTRDGEIWTEGLLYP